ncbi:cysteine--tRNA ligase [endosymbiont GvMRE of Glomus versiforme]|uniref:cysteine--tRNA ligase n=1 Tax=endosymbiont GvMRE of Glomus versiforme TaxID=2039283 RepID=UPI000EE58578|nr:cysteine--tRNA ligase [endosymbiont GvMRE of Glomus versiforme]RHZ35431.1 Cysteine--tRNA ligase [endosymbiont GvMRE of Glomus versiforme]
MKLQLFNSLENKLTALEINPGQIINIYLCGPTVYDHIHVGNLRPVIIFDVLYRLLLHLKVKVNYVQNITDIDDKIIAKAQKVEKSEKQISDYYIQSYLANLTLYNVLLPTHLPRVTNYIPQVQKFINNLLKNNVAYQQAGEVFFSIEKVNEYGKLSGQNLEKLKNIEGLASENKKNNKDFVLWKKTTKGIVWNSPWGTGRPGWHAECAAFINELFQGKTIDIHGGGNDLLFPHHENERIQYLTHNNKELSKIWFHVSHIHWQKKKMSKSLSNVILAEQFARKYDPNTLRYLILNSSYKQVINLNTELIRQAIDYVKKIKNLLKKINFYFYTENIKIKKKKTKKSEEVIARLLKNLNTAYVLYDLRKIINFLNKNINKKEINKGEIQESVSNFWFISNILGFNFSLSTYDSSTKLLIKKWRELRDKGEYLNADKIRKRLQKINVL